MKKPYWYLSFVGECPVCGKDASYKTRQYSSKPALAKNRVVYLADSQTYDHCLEG
jgi:hypothetical protein